MLKQFEFPVYFRPTKTDFEARMILKKKPFQSSNYFLC